MATIKPFKGLRPPKELVEQVESRPYDVLDSEEARAEAGDTMRSHSITSLSRRLISLSAPANMTSAFMHVLLRTLLSSRRKDGLFRMSRRCTTSMRRL